MFLIRDDTNMSSQEPIQSVEKYKFSSANYAPISPLNCYVIGQNVAWCQLKNLQKVLVWLRNAIIRRFAVGFESLNSHSTKKSANFFADFLVFQGSESRAGSPGKNFQKGTLDLPTLKSFLNFYLL